MMFHPLWPLILFNRISRTGSGSMIALLHDLQRENKFKIVLNQANPPYSVLSSNNPRKQWILEQVPNEKLIDAFNNVQQFVNESSKYSEPTVWIRHYGVIDYRKHGASWSPYFFNTVRNPIDRVSSSVLYNLLNIK